MRIVRGKVWSEFYHVLIAPRNVINAIQSIQLQEPGNRDDLMGMRAELENEIQGAQSRIEAAMREERGAAAAAQLAAQRSHKPQACLTPCTPHSGHDIADLLAPPLPLRPWGTAESEGVSGEPPAQVS